MSPLTLNLSPVAAQEAFLRAASEGTTVDELVKRIVESALAPRDDDPLEKAASLSDDDILAMADYQLEPTEQQRLDQLLEINSESQLTADQKVQLDALMKLYDEGVLRKSIGWAEAVRRGLRKSLF